MATEAPWSGEVELSWKGTVALALRIPGWAESHQVSVEGGQVRDGYLYLPPSTDGKVKIVFGIRTSFMYANPKAGKNEVCLMRGPIVYCAEDVDNDVDIDNIAVIPGQTKEGKQFKIVDHEVLPITVRGKELKCADSSRLYDRVPWAESEERDLVFIPYYARANRGGNGGMRVWCFRA